MNNRPDPRSITGHRFGRLVAMKQVERTPHGVVWEFLCDCGAPVRRLLARAMAADERGVDQMCDVCSRHANSERLTLINGMNRSRTRALSGGHLWPDDEIDGLTAEIASDIAEYMGFAPEPEIRGVVGSVDSDLWPNGCSLVL